MRILLTFVLLSIIWSCSLQKNRNNQIEQIKDQLIKKDDIIDGRWPEYTVEGKWKFRKKVNWFSGFTGGELFLMYELTKDEELKRRALIHADSLLNYAGIDYTHDMGFIFLPTCVRAYNETGEEKYKKAALLAAEMLYKRFNTNGNFIRAWGKLGSEKKAGWIIIDTMMNLELLFWTYEVSGDQKYYDVALSHAQTTLKAAIRKDYSSYHVIEFDPETGEVLKKRTHQGFGDESTWARGQAWGVYGFTNSFKRTQDSVFLETAQKMADYYINKLPEDNVPFWDLDLAGEDVLKDASAGAVLASGLFDLAELSNGLLSDKYRNYAKKITQSLLENYTFKSSNRDTEQGLLIHAIYHHHKGWGMDESYPAGDYFFMEALNKYFKLINK
ncbi:MAG: glucoronyl hydrolase [Calditrichaeota bacterium]|nr:MAG: glucoronyl hydrolase [Calditrichota bacterium]MBL1205596.1 glucoronyl hydrolase [Calditrichota bacterium]NOG45425.1 glucoronyl hydrolase [Calditrichota bacterium]